MHARGRVLARRLRGLPGRERDAAEIVKPRVMAVAVDHHGILEAAGKRIVILRRGEQDGIGGLFGDGNKLVLIFSGMDGSGKNGYAGSALYTKDP